jgi:hypothetical protein
MVETIFQIAGSCFKLVKLVEIVQIAINKLLTKTIGFIILFKTMIFIPKKYVPRWMDRWING